MITTVRRRIAGLAAFAVLGAGALAGCSGATSGDTASTTSAVSVSAAQTATEVLAADKEAHSADDTGGDTSTTTTITLNGDSAKVSGDGSDNVTIDGSTATITAEGTYVLSDSLTDGQVIIDASSGMVVSPTTDAKQGWVSATLDSAVEAGTVIQIANVDNEVIATYTTAKTVQNVVVSTAEITSGDTYTVHTGGSASGTTTGGLSAGGELGSSTSVATVTAGEAAAGGMGGGGGGPR